MVVIDKSSVSFRCGLGFRVNETEGAGIGTQGSCPAPLDTLSRGQINKMRLRDKTARRRIE